MTTWPHLSVTTADMGFLVQQSPVSRPWMYPRPPFYLQPYSVGITAPKEMGGNTGLKTATTSSVFVTVHSGPDPLPATNISKRGEKKKEAVERWVYCIGRRFLQILKKLWNGSRFQLSRHPQVKGKVLHLCNCLWDILTCHRRTRPNSQSKGPLLPWSQTTAVQTCPPQSLFTLAKFRTVYFLIRECLRKNFAGETSQITDNKP